MFLRRLTVTDGGRARGKDHARQAADEANSRGPVTVCRARRPTDAEIEATLRWAEFEELRNQR